eukprot:SAG11_NODE_187_length_13061_cov_10.715322_8_plen_109_part_00
MIIHDLISGSTRCPARTPERCPPTTTTAAAASAVAAAPAAAPATDGILALALWVVWRILDPGGTAAQQPPVAGHGHGRVVGTCKVHEGRAVKLPLFLIKIRAESAAFT